MLTEDEVKRYIETYYQSHGYDVAVAWGHTKGIDIVARNGVETIAIEAKGCGSRPQMRVNYFLSILGETLQRMENAQWQYYIALPKMSQYVGLWDRLPAPAKQRTQIKLILVDETGNLEFYS